MKIRLKIKYDLLKDYIVPISIFLAALLIYYLGIFNKLMFPNPFSIIKQFFVLMISKEIYSEIFLTLNRVILGTIISILIGVPFGLVLGYFTKLYDMFEFIIDFSRSIPATALFPLFMLFFGIGNTSKIMLGAWIATLVIIVNTSYGVRHANKVYLKMAKVYKTSKMYILLHIVFPGALPNIFSGLRIGVSLVLIVVIVTEMFIGSVDGLGQSILNAQLTYNIPKMYALIIITGMLGYLLNILFLTLERRIIHWTENNNKNNNDDKNNEDDDNNNKN